VYIELHMIQNFSPANLNRDDTGNPKDCTFGGYRRARVSSQSLKRAIRHEDIFSKTTEVPKGDRSKWMSRPIKDKLIEVGKAEEDAMSVAVAFVNDYAAKSDKKNPERSNVLIYFTQEEVNSAVEALLKNWDEAVKAANAKTPKSLKDVISSLEKSTKTRTSAPDIALFGRMLAEHPSLNIDAACQVAHAISTHSIKMEMDFYTAVDELQKSSDDEGAGAGMMGFTNFNSACFYRYARIDWDLLVKNLGNDKALARRTVEGFMRAALDAIPTGKQNAFAAQNPTNLALALLREDGQSWNLANAFEEPVHPKGNSGLIRRSIEALDTYWGDMKERRDDAEFKVISVYTDSAKSEEALNTLAEYSNPKLSAWIETINEALPKE
jgi:CRISPR system Cascade subunit CasC